jgi:hypothetical protein
MNTVQLAHFSVKEYLLSTREMSWRLDEELSHLCIIKAVIVYYLELMASIDVTNSAASVEDLHKNHSLAVYCASRMSDHLAHLNPRDHPDLTESLQHLPDPSSQYTLDRRLGLWYFYEKFDIHAASIPKQLEVSTLRIATDLGLPVIC